MNIILTLHITTLLCRIMHVGSVVLSLYFVFQISVQALLTYLADFLLKSKVEAPKKKVKKTSVAVSELVYGAMSPTDVQKAVEKEFEMALQDRVMEETKEKKNAVESYVYDMRNKVGEDLSLLTLLGLM